MEIWKKNLLACTIVATSVIGWGECRKKWKGFEREAQKILNNDPNSKKVRNLQYNLPRYLFPKVDSNEFEVLKKDPTAYRKNKERIYKRNLDLLIEYESLISNENTQKNLEQINNYNKKSYKWVTRATFCGLPGILGIFYLGHNVHGWLRKNLKKKRID